MAKPRKSQSGVRAGVSSATKAHRAPKHVAEDNPQRALYRAIDFYPTPPWAARAGAELIKRLDPDAHSVWEPACGQGHMAEPLKEYFQLVTATDVHDHGYGKVQDFLDPSAGRLRGEFDWIVTNPPFENGGQFVELGLKRARIGVAVLCRLQFIEGGERYPLFMRKPTLSLLAPFAERVPMQLGSWDPELASATAYAWFVWDKRLTWSGGRIEIIPPGTRDRLWKADDVRRFAPLAPAPLLEAV